MKSKGALLSGQAPWLQPLLTDISPISEPSLISLQMTLVDTMLVTSVFEVSSIGEALAAPAMMTIATKAFFEANNMAG